MWIGDPAMGEGIGVGRQKTTEPVVQAGFRYSQ
jgi:hypothetical protein